MEAPQPATQPGGLSLNSIGQFVKKYWSDYLILFLVAGTVVTLDQMIKVWVRANVPLGGDWLPAWLSWLLPYARVRYWYNSGAAFGLFQNGNTIFMILAVIVAGAILYYLPRTARKDWWLRLALCMQFAGALGHFVDRIQFGHVTDFISVGNFAIFNIADASITVGVAILILGVWLTERAEKRRQAALAAGTPAADKNEAPLPTNEASGPEDKAKAAYQNPAPGGVREASPELSVGDPAAGDGGESSLIKGSKGE
jgi:signal peptidase II